LNTALVRYGTHAHTQASIRLIPILRNALAAELSVAPVVITSSINTRCCGQSPGLAVKASFRLRLRAAASSSDCGAVARVRVRTSVSNGRRRARASGRASSSA